MQYRGWTIVSDYCGFVATHDKNHDESGDWQINANSIENAKEEIDETEDSYEISMAIAAFVQATK